MVGFPTSVFKTDAIDRSANPLLNLMPSELAPRYLIKLFPDLDILVRRSLWLGFKNNIHYVHPVYDANVLEVFGHDCIVSHLGVRKKELNLSKEKVHIAEREGSAFPYEPSLYLDSHPVLGGDKVYAIPVWIVLQSYANEPIDLLDHFPCWNVVLIVQRLLEYFGVIIHKVVSVGVEPTNNSF